jgi:integrase
MRKPLTEIVVKKTRPPAAGITELWDVDPRGFGLRITANGARSYFIMYRAGDGADRRQRRMTIGDANLLKLGEARELARARLKLAKAGTDPAVRVVLPERLLVRDALGRYMAQHVTPNLRPRTVAAWAAFQRDVLKPWGDRPLDGITKADVIQLVDAVIERGAQVSANRLFEALRAFFNWAVGKGLVPGSPCAGAKKPVKEVARERFLNAQEIRWFWAATGEIGAPFGDLFRLLLVTAQRREEVRGMRWGEVDIKKRTWTIPASRAKNGKQHEVALSDPAIGILEAIAARRPDRDRVFGSDRPRLPGWPPISGLSRAKRRLDAAMRTRAGKPIAPFTLHDLRRTVVDQMMEIGVDPHVADKILAHKSGVIRGVQAIYNRHQFEPQQRAALEKWGRHLAALVGGGGVAEVVTLRARG